MDVPSGSIDLHVRALEGFPDDEDSEFGLSDLRYAVLELVLRLVPRNDDAAQPRFRCLRRTLEDLNHLEQRLASLGVDGREAQPLKFSLLIARYVDALSRPRFVPATSQTQRLLGQLELALVSLLSSHASSSTVVKQFFGLEPCSLLVEKADRYLDAHGAQEEDATLVGGGSFAHEISVGANSVVVWKFAFDSETIDFSAAYTPGSQSEDEAEQDGVAVDPYSEAALGWPVGRTEVKESVVLQYLTRHARSSSESNWICGIYRVPEIEGESGGVVTMEWSDAGAASIFSKSIKFRAVVISGSEGEALYNELVSGQNDTDDEPLEWLKDRVASSPLMTWESEACEVTVTADLNDHHVEVFAVEASRAHELQVRELDAKVFKLEEELQTVRQELRTTKSELEISSEIYKASLETIAQLEIAPSRSQGVNGNPNGQLSHSIDHDEGEEDSYGEEEDVFGSDEEGDERDAADAEKDRLRDLVATFQEQCLWRSIETSESEKRNLALEAELAKLDEQVKSLTSDLATKDEALATSHAENQKLKAQKAVLVKEVKRLQPYSQVNLSELIREAEEARMMQRSLQMQLQALQAASSPETDHPRSSAANE